MTKYECPTCGSGDHMMRSMAGAGKMRCGECNRVCKEAEARVARPRGAKRHTTRGRSSRQEKRTVHSYGGRTTLNSGAMDDKGDVVVEGRLRFEDKTTRGRSYVLKLDDLLRLATQTRGDEMPVMKVCFEDDLNQQYCIIPQAWFAQLLEEQDE